MNLNATFKFPIYLKSNTIVVESTEHFSDTVQIINPFLPFKFFLSDKVTATRSNIYFKVIE